MRTMTMQTPFGLVDHDSYQLHVFCDGLVMGSRVFKTPTLYHASAWLWREGQDVVEVANDEGGMTQSDAGHLDISGAALGISAGPDGGRWAVGDDLVVDFRPQTEFRWPDTRSEVVHQPDMQVTLTVDGESHSGIGYTKRYGWTPAPRHWGYRFIQGYADDRRINLWTAEATFGEAQYDYFKILRPDGRLAEAGRWDSCHRDEGARGIIDGEEVRVTMEELGRWEAPLRSAAMDSLMRQRVVRLNVETDAASHTGIAINESCYGSLG